MPKDKQDNTVRYCMELQHDESNPHPKISVSPCLHVTLSIKLTLALRLFALTTLVNIHNFLIYVLKFSVQSLPYSVTIIPTCSIIHYGNIIFDLRLHDLHPAFQEHN